MKNKIIHAFFIEKVLKDDRGGGGRGSVRSVLMARHDDDDGILSFPPVYSLSFNLVIVHIYATFEIQMYC